jgi:hypothetical protein
VDLNRNAKYGYAHQELRKRYAILIDGRGSIPCARCGEPITRGMRWDLGHTDGAGPRAYNGPEHIRCSRATAGRGIANTGNGNGNGNHWRGKPAPPIFDASRCSRDW